MGYSSADRNAVSGNLVGNVIILKHLESGEPDKAANWCKEFIVNGHNYQISEPSWVEYLRGYFRSKPRPFKFSSTISTKVDEVAKTYSPNVIDVESSVREVWGPKVKVEVNIDNR